MEVDPARRIDYENYSTVQKNRFISFVLGIVALVVLVFGGMSLQGPSLLEGPMLYYSTAILATLYIAHKFYVIMSEKGIETIKASISLASSIVLLTLAILGAAHVGNANYTLGIVIASSISWAAWLCAFCIQE